MSAASIALNRFGLGARPDDAPPADPHRHLLDQLDRFDPRPAAIAALPGSAQAIADLLTLRDDAAALRRDAPSPAAPLAPGQPDPAEQARRDLRQTLQRQFNDGYSAAVAARTAVAAASPAPFMERMVHFWANHFAVSAEGLRMVGLAHTLEMEAIRPNLLRRFADMQAAVARHPAMLVYLNQAQSVGPNSDAGRLTAARQARNPRARALGLNENLAREILELHTLGADGGYSQADVTELARAMTGWSVGGGDETPGALARLSRPAPVGAFVFQPAWHEPGDRTLMGRRYPAGGEEQAAAMFAFAAGHPATARHVARKLAAHVAGDEPAPALVARLQAEFLRTGGDLPSLYRALIAAPEPWAQPFAKFRTPWDWLVAALRSTAAPPPPPRALVRTLAQLGQPTWRPGAPKGWDDTAAAWAAPDALVRRVEAAQALAAALPPELDARALAPILLPGALSAATAGEIARAEDGAQALALLLASPEFLRR